MKQLNLWLILSLLTPFGAWSQTILSPDQAQKVLTQSPLSIGKNPVLIERSYPLDPSSIPLGASIRSAVTAVKIGESSNIYSNLDEGQHPISLIPTAGGNSLLTFSYRQNITTCGGTAQDNGRIRFSYSQDNGQSWSVQSSLVVSPGSPAPLNTCFGVRDLTPQLMGAFRYPQGALFSTTGTMNPADLGLVTTANVAGSNGWGGTGNTLATQLLSSSPTITQEGIQLDSLAGFFMSSLVQRVPGEFWQVATNTLSGEFVLLKGLWDNTTQQVTWAIAEILRPNHSSSYDGGVRLINGQIAFSPDGNTGYLAWLGDLVGERDSIYAPIFVKSDDGGQTWGTPQEFPLNDFVEIADTLLAVKTFDPSLNDTVSLATGKASTAFDFDLVVDSLGNPHLVAMVAAASTIAAPDVGYVIFTALPMRMYDFTIDPFGDWNGLYLGPIQSFRGYFGLDANGGTNGDFVQVDVHPQASRSPDGSKVFFTWTDTDTLNLPPQSGPGNFNGNFMNYMPNLWMRGVAIGSGQVSARTSPTQNDLVFSGAALVPKMSPEVVVTGGQNQLPIVVSRLTTGTIFGPTDHFYLTDVSIADNAFTENPIWFANCASIAFDNGIRIVRPSCGMSDGAVKAIPLGGVAPYHYQWDSQLSLDTSQSISNVGPGRYQLVITDARACTDTLYAEVKSAVFPTIVANPLTPITCQGANNGALSVAATGNGPFTYLWSNGQSGAQATTLGPGTYRCTVTDQNGCINWLDQELVEPSEMALDFQTFDISCAGDNSGRVLTSVSGGTPPYSFSWSHGPTTRHLRSLASGNYALTVVDALGCSKSESVIISSPANLTMTVSSSPNVSCATFNGFISASSSGGTPPYVYEFKGALGTYNANFVFGQPGGSFAVTCTDANGCVVRDTSRISNQFSLGPVLSTTVTDATCGPTGAIDLTVSGGNGGPFAYNWSNGATTEDLSGVAPGSYALVATDNQGCPSDTLITIAETTPISLSETIAEPGCLSLGDGRISLTASGPGTFSYQWADGATSATRIGLSPGTYSVIVSNGAGCAVERSYQLLNPDHPLRIYAAVEDVRCAGAADGSLSIQVEGGTGSYTYSWSNGATSNDLPNLTPGTYTLTVTDSLCQTSGTFTVDEPAPLQLQLSTTPNAGDSTNTAYDGEVIAQLTGGTPPYQYVWWGPDELYQQGASRLTELCGSTYRLAIADANGCSLPLDSAVVGITGNGINCPEMTSVDPTLNWELRLYPNPNQGQFQLHLQTGQLLKTHLQLQNAQGQTVWTGVLPASLQGEHQLALASLPAGIYLLRIRQGDAELSRKVVINR